MTRVAATGRPPDQQPKAHQRPEAEAAARSFADRLHAMIRRDIASGDGRRPFGGRTMRPTVEAFGAHGFFNGSVPLAGRGAETAGLTDLYRQPRSSAATGGIDLTTWMPRSARPETIQAEVATAGPPISPAADVVGGPLTQRTAIPTAARDHDAPASLSIRGTAVPGSPAASGAEPDLSEPPTAAPRRRVAREQNASTVKVALGLDGAGVSVAVIGGRVGPDEKGVLHRAVAQLLARHGLTLRALRVAPYPTAASGQRGEG